MSTNYKYIFNDSIDYLILVDFFLIPFTMNWNEKQIIQAQLSVFREEN